MYNAEVQCFIFHSMIIRFIPGRQNTAITGTTRQNEVSSYHQISPTRTPVAARYYEEEIQDCLHRQESKRCRCVVLLLSPVD